jgi:hypothetical protein
MPVISRFLGIVIFMYWKDHAPPHFHATYQGREVTIEIETGAVSGRMPAKQLQIVQQWRMKHKAALLDNWSSAMEKRAFRPVPPWED